jgi:hypothetical protein
METLEALVLLEWADGTNGTDKYRLVARAKQRTPCWVIEKCYKDALGEDAWRSVATAANGGCLQAPINALAADLLRSM